MKITALVLAFITSIFADDDLLNTLNNRYTPAKMNKMTDEGSYKYIIKFDSSIALNNINELKLNRDIKWNNYIIVDNKLTELKFPQEIQNKIDQSESFFDRKEFKKSIDILNSIPKENFNNYPYIYTLIGNSYYALQDYSKAIELFTKSISINFIDFKAHTFIADAYLKLNDIENAKNEIATALMLNRSYSLAIEIAERINKPRFYSLKTGIIRAPFHYLKKNDNDVILTFKNSKSLEWLGFATCNLIWEYEPEMNDYKSQDDDIHQNRIKHCLVHHLINASQEKFKGKNDIYSKILINAIINKQINSLVYWEYNSFLHPELTLLLPKSIQNDIILYIKKYYLSDFDQ